MTDELNLNVNIIPNMSAVDAALKKPKSIISKLPGHAARTLLSKMPSYEKPPKTMMKGDMATGDPFAVFKREKTQVGKIGLDSLKKKKTGKEGEPKLDMKSHFDALKKWGRVFKIDLYWRWLKGAFLSITKYMPLLGKFGEIITAALTLIFTALLLPFLPGILEALKWLLDKSVAFFNWMKSMEGLTPSAFAEKITTDMNKFFAETNWEGFGKTIGTKINEAITLVDDLLKKVQWETIGKSIGGFINGVVETLDATKIGTTLADLINSNVKFLDSVFDNVKWDEVGNKIGTFASTVILETDWIKIGDLIGSAFLSAIKLGLIGIPGGLIKGGLAKGQDMTKDLADKLGKKPEDVNILDKFFPGWDKSPSLFLSKGGIVTSPTEAMIAESGPEAVIPLDQMKNMGGTNITISGLVDEYKFRSIIKEEIDKSNRRMYNARGAVGV